MFGRSVEYKSAEQIAVMRRAGIVVADVLATVREAVAPGVTTLDLDAVARGVIDRHGATSNFLGYHGFPAVICTSVNDEVVHGIPGERVLAAGDLVSVDAGAIVEGWHGDAAITVAVGEVSPAAAELSRVTEAALWAGVEAAQPGARLGDVGHAIATSIAAAGDYGIVEGFTGHGIGTEMHQDPDVPNIGRAGSGMRLKPGLVIAIEPMVSLGSPYTQILEDDWTAVTVDGSRAAHWEHTVAITADGPVVLTLPA
ncbi:type I methionyl aminopeptidase [Aeromicrobium sp. Leaf350]|uniref:type I methionyl aminopeptidase n=1 Tax=Aeromicrobium sp. Leaf350 TaxID=2876565 RepID=UPI001E52AD34|nr:type I methionyl aminopeptidase [Aeromicrobium sp. Leaf350]